MCYAGNGAAKQFFEIALKPIACVQKDGGQPQAISSFEAGFQAVLEGSCDYFYTLEGQVLSQSRGRYCGKLTAVGRKFFETSVSFILPRNSNLTLPISLTTLRMREEDKLVSASTFAEREWCPDITDATLDWDKMKVFFYVAYSGLGVMLALMAADWNGVTPNVNAENLRPASDADQKNFPAGGATTTPVDAIPGSMTDVVVVPRSKMDNIRTSSDGSSSGDEFSSRS